MSAPKFKVGQVVMVRFKKGTEYPGLIKDIAFSTDGSVAAYWLSYWGWMSEPELRPLTDEERGQ